MHIPEYELAFRLFLACVFGGIVGFERERSDSPAGFRTHILVCLGSALIMVLSMYGFNDFTSVNNFDKDSFSLNNARVVISQNNGTKLLFKQRGIFST